MSRFAVAAPHDLAVRAAARVADGGGNVVDAVVAAAAALTVVYPHQCSLGGDLFAILRFGVVPSWPLERVVILAFAVYLLFVAPIFRWSRIIWIYVGERFAW